MEPPALAELEIMRRARSGETTLIAAVEQFYGIEFADGRPSNISRKNSKYIIMPNKFKQFSLNMLFR